MFKAREIYCQTGKIPKQMIWNWEEKRLVSIVFPIFTILALILIFYGIDSWKWDGNQYIPNYNPLNVPMYRKGVFCNERMPNQLSQTTAIIQISSFIEYVLLCWAMHAQWHIESDYNIFHELRSITILWFFCNTLLNFVWILGRPLIW